MRQLSTARPTGDIRLWENKLLKQGPWLVSDGSRLEAKVNDTSCLNLQRELQSGPNTPSLPRMSWDKPSLLPIEIEWICSLYDWTTYNPASITEDSLGAWSWALYIKHII